MVKFFEKETAPLTEYEKETLLPIMVKCLSNKVGKEKAITNEKMCEKMMKHGYIISTARVRKIINHIRINGLIECLMATNYGYYITKDKKEMIDYISSLSGRIDAIQAVKNEMEEQMRRMDDKAL